MTSPAGPLEPILRTFAPRRENVVAGYILSLLAVSAGVGVFFVEPPTKPTAVALYRVFGVACIAVGAAILAFAVSLTFSRTDLCERGIRRRSVTGTAEMPWADVDIVRLNVSEGPHGSRKGGHPFVTIHAHGRAYRFGPNNVGNFDDFVEALRAVTADREHLWEVSFRAGERWWATVTAAGGLLLTAFAFVTYHMIADAENNAGGQPVRLHWVVYLLYAAGGKWLAAGVMFAGGAAMIVYGLVSRVRSGESRVPSRRTGPTGGGDGPSESLTRPR